MKKEIPANVFNQLFLVPTLWAHKHKDEKGWNRDFVEFCDTCKERMERAIDEGNVCSKHPLAYYEPSTNGHFEYCDECSKDIDTPLR